MDPFFAHLAGARKKSFVTEPIITLAVAAPCRRSTDRTPTMAPRREDPSNMNRLVVGWSLVLGACFYGVLMDRRLSTPLAEASAIGTTKKPRTARTHAVRDALRDAIRIRTCSSTLAAPPLVAGAWGCRESMLHEHASPTAD
jgi:hypothetical protein